MNGGALIEKEVMLEMDAYGVPHYPVSRGPAVEEPTHA